MEHMLTLDREAAQVEQRASSARADLARQLRLEALLGDDVLTADVIYSGAPWSERGGAVTVDGLDVPGLRLVGRSAQTGAVVARSPNIHNPHTAEPVPGKVVVLAANAERGPR